MGKFALIGCPLGHSLSPIIHKELFKINGSGSTYRLNEIPAESFESQAPRLLGELDGFNVTIPYKTDIIHLLDELDYKAELFGAVNTVKITNGSAKGFNTDCDGFLRSLKSAGIALGGSVLLCGSGGVARMIAFECACARCRLTIAVRPADIPFANKIKDEIKEKLSADAKVILLDEVRGGFDLVINGTPVGMFPNTDCCVLGEDIIKNSSAAFDVIYNPGETLFLKYAAHAGIKNSNGLSMLVWQAAVAQEIWLGCEFSQSDIDKIAKTANKALPAKK
ncbi:MAG: shikimate dehydrogenase [Clostridiales bacterium]|nr:shikimate dehydrogenase [Clostridiales bacterium]